MDCQTLRIAHFNMRSYATSIMQPNGEAQGTSCEGWDHGDHILEKMGNLALESFDENEEVQSTPSEDGSSNDGQEGANSKLNKEGAAENWSLHSLLDSIADPDEPNGEPLNPSQDEIYALPQGFAPPLGLKNIEAIYGLFRSERNAAQGTAAHGEESSTKEAEDTRKAIKRKRSSRLPRHKTRLSKLKDQDPESYKAIKGNLTKAKRLKKRRMGLPATDSALLQRHVSNVKVVFGSSSSLSFEHSKPGWIGIQAPTSPQNSLAPSEQLYPDIDVDSRWSEEVKNRVNNGWEYIKNDVK
jgi:hypothetical protein